MTARIAVGVIGAPHGVRGELRIKPYTEDPLALKGYGPLETADGVRRFAVKSARVQGHMVVVRLEGVDDRDAAAALTNTELYVPRERLPTTADGEFYQSDLIGLRVEHRETGVVLGTISGVVNFGAGDLFEIARENLDSVFLPFTEAFVPKVDIAGGKVLVSPPDGAFDTTADDGRP